MYIPRNISGPPIPK